MDWDFHVGFVAVMAYVIGAIKGYCWCWLTRKRDKP